MNDAKTVVEVDTKSCPMCRQSIPDSAEKCHHCQSWVDSPPGFWIRLYAALIDNLLLGLVVTAMDYAFLAYSGHHADDQTIMRVSSFAWMSYTVSMVAQQGATYGKKWCGIRIEKVDGSKVTYMQALGRAFAESLSIVLLGIGYLMMGLRSDRRALHDLMAGTRVVYARDTAVTKRRWALTPIGVIAIILGNIGLVGWAVYDASRDSIPGHIETSRSEQRRRAAEELDQRLIGLPLDQAEALLNENGYGRDGETRQVTRVRGSEGDFDALLVSTEDGWSKVLILDRGRHGHVVKRVEDEPDNWLNSWFFPKAEEERVRSLKRQATENSAFMEVDPLSTPNPTPAPAREDRSAMASQTAASQERKVPPPKQRPRHHRKQAVTQPERSQPSQADAVSEAEKAMGF